MVDTIEEKEPRGTRNMLVMILPAIRRQITQIVSLRITMVKMGNHGQIGQIMLREKEAVNLTRMKM